MENPTWTFWPTQYNPQRRGVGTGAQADVHTVRVWLDLRTRLCWQQVQHSNTGLWGKQQRVKMAFPPVTTPPPPPEHQHLPSSIHMCCESFFKHLLRFASPSEVTLQSRGWPFFLTSAYSDAQEFSVQTLISLISLNDLQPHSFNTVW